MTTIDHGLRMATSPAGEPVEIVPDDEWLERFQPLTESAVGLRFTGLWNVRRGYLLPLWNEGTVTSEAGRATTRLVEISRRYGKPVTNVGFNGQINNNPMMHAAIEREIRGKRTFKIRLVTLPALWHDRLVNDKLAKKKAKQAPVENHPAVMETAEPTPQPTTNGFTPAWGVASILHAAHHESIPLGALPDVHDLIVHVERVLDGLNGH